MKKRKSNKIFWFLVLVIVVFIVLMVLNIFKKSSVNVPLLDSKFCATDEDCLVTNYRSLQCCVTCVVDPINTKVANERKRWRDDNCKDYTTKIKKYSDPSYPKELIPDKWSDCLEYSECSALTQHYNVFCIDNNCQIIEKKIMS